MQANIVPYIAGASSELNRAAPAVKALEEWFNKIGDILVADKREEIKKLLETYKNDNL